MEIQSPLIIFLDKNLKKIYLKWFLKKIFLSNYLSYWETSEKIE
ncbi:hypothetical protein PRV_02360 [Mycoplasma parvum str. Indiana]|uniref:Uncharacterized protein n=1 Tax=Mycoplasma parvum str. Indiana TaxID=1403316 RepID=U5NG83_9MOLU|nr:hypothetical protein PRV_02360 [Mycoplasma parvum str. Indiana]